ncbi:flagellin C-terminal helical region [Halolactibacillus halophilus]|uniref:Flagellin n=2 Tax=Halolactibacillus halophilus TaxID=306540 RepID=A0A1I5QAP6_9BACI|nr:hypothetical protein HHA03_12450 [Halolactibacillus halophilus]SFP43187.1 flagellin C-terminal helical region [Halolactibacillus halophilus]
MRAQIRGLQQAERNAQNAISLVDVAEGGMQEISASLQRMRELSVQAATDTLSTSDRKTIDEEVAQLKEGIRDVVKHTEFNTQKVLANEELKASEIESRHEQKVIDLNTNTSTQTVQSQTFPYKEDAAISPSTSYVNKNNRSLSETLNITDSHSESGSTVAEYEPRYSDDGTAIVFKSTRTNTDYQVPVDGLADPTAVTNPDVMSFRSVSPDGNLRLKETEDGLVVEKKSGYNTWEVVSNVIEDYNTNLSNSKGYTFKDTDDAGNIDFLYADKTGNIKEVTLDALTGDVVNQRSIIVTTDNLNIPSNSQTITLSSAPQRYRMNETTASLIVTKHNDAGSRELTYWDKAGTEPSDGYYTVTGATVEFFGDAVIGAEDGDDATDYYQFDYASSPAVALDDYHVKLPNNTEHYHLDGTDGPRSLKVVIGSRVVEQADYLNTQPSDHTTSGVYYNEPDNRLEFYSDMRPSGDEEVSIDYIVDATNDDAFSHPFVSGLDTYNIKSADSTLNRPFRVFVGGNEIKYSDTNGFTYDRDTGMILIHGASRPDVSSGEEVTIDYVSDLTADDTTEDVYGIKMPADTLPEAYHLDEADGLPASIAVYRNTTSGEERITYSDTNGFQYDKNNKIIKLFGDARPDAGDTYSLRFVEDSLNAQEVNDIVEVRLSSVPEEYDISGDGDLNSVAVKVGFRDIAYDESKTNGYYYDENRQTLQLYGDARPSSDESISIEYIYEPSAATRLNDTYDVTVSPAPPSYGLVDQTEPKSVRVYLDGSEIEYDSNHGFTYDEETGRVSLHGDARLNAETTIGELNVRTVDPNQLEVAYLKNERVHRVFLNDTELKPAPPTGYIAKDGIVTVSDDLRPDAAESSYTIKVESIDQPTSMPLDDTGLLFDPYEDIFKSSEMVKADILKPTVKVTLNGEEVNQTLYEVQGSELVFKQPLELEPPSNTLDVDYDVEHALAYEENAYTMQVGANTGDYLDVKIDSFNNLLLKIKGIDVLNRERADQTIALLDQHIQYTSGERSRIGAMRNRLEHIVNINGNSSENLTASESGIRDADVAKQMMDLTKVNILSQAQVTIQAQSQTMSRTVLKLLE